jgi:hypothetical protein
VTRERERSLEGGLTCSVSKVVQVARYGWRKSVVPGMTKTERKARKEEQVIADDLPACARDHPPPSSTQSRFTSGLCAFLRHALHDPCEV